MSNLGFFKVLGLMTVALMCAALALQATAAEIPHTRIQWVWSPTSADVNKATSALATGHAARAVRLAGTAITTASTSSDRLIAVHNLCLAQLSQGDITRAETHCRRALLTSDNARVVPHRGALITSDSTDTGAQKLVTVIRANVAKAYGAAAADSFTNSVAAAW